MKPTIFYAFLPFIVTSVLRAQQQDVVIGSSIGWGMPSEPAVIMNPM